MQSAKQNGTKKMVLKKFVREFPLSCLFISRMTEVLVPDIKGVSKKGNPILACRCA
jgi:hypothetical protein